MLAFAFFLQKGNFLKSLLKIHLKNPLFTLKSINSKLIFRIKMNNLFRSIKIVKKMSNCVILGLFLFVKIVFWLLLLLLLIDH